MLAQGEWRSEVKTKVGHNNKKAANDEQNGGGGSRGRGRSRATRTEGYVGLRPRVN